MKKVSEEKLKNLSLKSGALIQKLCTGIGERSVGGAGNKKAAEYIEKEFLSSGWETLSQEFNAFDWKNEGAVLKTGKEEFEVFSSPYSKGCSAEGKIREIRKLSELENSDSAGKILLLRGEIAAEQLMPKSFVFYNPEKHRRTIAALEKSGAAALICATSRNSGLAGGVYPFPLIEDGDFEIPSVYMTEEESDRILNHIDSSFSLLSKAERIPSSGRNIIAKKGGGEGIIAVTAHLDTKNGTPGAIDNATGVAVLILLSGLLRDYKGRPAIELTAFNGEDYYSVPGQMKYIAEKKGDFSDIILNINIDGAGYNEGSSQLSEYGLDEKISAAVSGVCGLYPGVGKGEQWPQGDHSIFVQNGVPAIAASSGWFIENMESQEITHTPKDNPEIVDHLKTAELAAAISEIIKEITE
ncbi:MAG: M28 family peptidase [Fibrobacterota bacterium]